jgi:hypothetical protein
MRYVHQRHPGGSLLGAARFRWPTRSPAPGIRGGAHGSTGSPGLRHAHLAGQRSLGWWLLAIVLTAHCRPRGRSSVRGYLLQISGMISRSPGSP